MLKRVKNKTHNKTKNVFKTKPARALVTENNNRSLSLVAWQCITHGAELQKTWQIEVKRHLPLLAAHPSPLPACFTQKYTIIQNIIYFIKKKRKKALTTGKIDRAIALHSSKHCF